MAVGPAGRGALVQFGRWLFSRQGRAAVLIAVGGGVSLGMVPNIVESFGLGPWLLWVLAVAGLVAALWGWMLARSRGIGIVVTLYPPDPSSPSRVDGAERVAEDNHESHIVIRRDQLWPGDRNVPDVEERVSVAYRQIQSRLREHRRSGLFTGAVFYYITAQVPDCYALGQRLGVEIHERIALMHASKQRDDLYIPVLTLDNVLREPFTNADRERLRAHLLPDEPKLQEVPSTPAEYRHRLGLIIRIARQGRMVYDAIYVAGTGRVLLDNGDHTGYWFDAADMSAPGAPCGAYVVIDTTPQYLADSPAVYSAMVRYIMKHWADACGEWSRKVGRSVEGVLFLNAPNEFAVALGALLGHEAAPVRHDMALVASNGGHR